MATEMFSETRSVGETVNCWPDTGALFKEIDKPATSSDRPSIELGFTAEDTDVARSVISQEESAATHCAENEGTAVAEPTLVAIETVSLTVPSTLSAW